MPPVHPAALVHHRERLQLRDGGLRLVAIADTHGRPHPQALTRVAELAPHHIVHAGDVGEPGVLEAFASVAPVSAVRGNIDAKAPDLPDLRTLAIHAGDTPILTIVLLHIALAGPKLRADAARLARAEGAALVVCGHSHVPFIGRDRGVAVFNPGSIGPRRFSLPIVLGVIDITRERVDLRHVDCESGAVWTPPCAS